MICLREVESGADYHPRCLEDLFGTAVVPSLDIELARLHTLGLAMAGHVSLSGIQRKVSLRLDSGHMTLQVATESGRYILKPQAQTFPNLPENEHLTMRLAELAGLEVPPCGLIWLKDRTLAYVVARFDRPPQGGKLRQEDFCQLASKSAKERYDGSAELCARIIRRYASEPLIEMLKLFRLLVFGWCTGNGDMHLKNLSLLTGQDGLHRFSPVYDLLNTRLVIPDDKLALSVGQKKTNLGRRKWLDFADYCGIPERPAGRVLDEMRPLLDDAEQLVARSFLPAAKKDEYSALLLKRTESLIEGRRAEGK